MSPSSYRPSRYRVLSLVRSIIRDPSLLLYVTIIYVLVGAAVVFWVFPDAITSKNISLVLSAAAVMVAVAWVRRLTSFRAEFVSLGEGEAAAALERGVASSAGTLKRDFDASISREIDRATKALAAQSDKIVREKLGQKIEQELGGNLIEVLGQKLADKTAAASNARSLRQSSSDAFVQMQIRAIQYADAANRQSNSFRLIAIGLALLGLGVLGGVLYTHYGRLLNNPKILEGHLEWPMLILTNGPAYAFVVLCEFLALIMFRYQSKALEYMRYFSNEATNIDARRIAFITALDILDKRSLEKIVTKLEATERNFIISKDQRTLELANNENDDRAFARLQHAFSLVRGDDSSGEVAAPPKRSRKKPDVG